MFGHPQIVSHSTMGPLIAPPHHQQFQHRLFTVPQACDNLWACQEAVNAPAWLQITHHAISRARLETYSPSEAFLCIQGAALRFTDQIVAQRALTADSSPISPSTQHPADLLETIWEEALWAAANLARICVGPAWRFQWLQRRAVLQPQHPQTTTGGDDATLSTATESLVPSSGAYTHAAAATHPNLLPMASPVAPTAVAATAATLDYLPSHHPAEIINVSTGGGTANSSPRSFSPMTFASQISNLASLWYPPIPEALPGVMLRFAAQSLDFCSLEASRSRSLAEAQRELVLALCCLSQEEEAHYMASGSQHGWTIPGAHQPVDTMMRYWLGSTTLEKADDQGKMGRSASNMQSQQHVETSAPLSPSVSDDDQQHDLSPASGLTESDFGGDQPPTTALSRSLPAEPTRSTLPPETSFESLKDRYVNWWLTLQVVRATTDLISAGWRPQQNAQTIVTYLLDIATKGIHLQGLVMTETENIHGKRSREERLAATLSAAEAIGALSALASRGILPETSLCMTTLVKLQMASADSPRLDRELFPSSKTFLTSNEEAEWHADRETFLSHRESCFADASDLMWVILAQESSALAGIQTLVAMAGGHDEMQTTALGSNSGRALLTTPDAQTAVVIRVLSGALWGNPPNVPGIGLLRLFWQDVLNLMRGKTSGVLLPPDRRKTSVASVLLTMEVIAALRRFVEGMIVGMNGAASLVAVEWTHLTELLKEDVLHLLRAAPDWQQEDERMQKLIGKIQVDTAALFAQLGELLDKSCNYELGTVHLISDEHCRTRLFTLLMRQACPLLSTFASESLAKSVIRSWCCAAFVPAKTGKFVESATAVVREAFARYDNAETNHAPSGFVHSALVRREALRFLSDDRAYSGVGSSNHGDAVGVSVGEGPMMLTCPLTTARYRTEIYHALLDAVLLPALLLTLDETAGANLKPVVVDASKGSTENSTSKRVNNDETRLKVLATKICGQLFRAEQGDQEYRILFLKELRRIALTESQFVDELELSQSDDESFSVSPAALPGDVSIALEAIWQLELCLDVPFRSHRLLHAVTTPIIDALCDILLFHSESMSKEAASSVPSSTLLCFAALLPLSRLRSSSTGQMVLLDRQEVLKFVPDSVGPILAKETFWLDQNEPNAGFSVATFVFEGPSPNEEVSSPPTKSFVSLRPVVEAICTAVVMSRSETALSFVDPELNSTFRACCIDTVGSFAMSGVSLDSSGLISHLLQDEAPTWTLEAMAVCKTASAVVPSFASCVGEEQADGNTEFFLHIEQVLNQVLEACTSADVEVVAVGCLALRGILSSLVTCYRTHKGKMSESIYSEVLATLTSRMKVLLKSFKRLDEDSEGVLRHAAVPGPSDFAFSIISSVYNILLSSRDAHASLGIDIRTDVATLCDRLVRELRVDKPCRALAIRCAWIALDTVGENGVRHVISKVALERKLTPPESHNHRDADIAYSVIAHRQLGTGGEGKGVEGYHEFAWKEAEFIRQFEVEKVDKQEKSAAWLCGTCLLTVRLGRKDSRYCGWVEVVLRGPSLRRRRLVRLASDLFISLDDPELFVVPSQPRRQSFPSAPTSQEDEHVSIELPTSMTEYNADDVMTKALAMLEKAESMLGPPPARYPLIETIGNEGDHQSHGDDTSTHDVNKSPRTYRKQGSSTPQSGSLPGTPRRYSSASPSTDSLSTDKEFQQPIPPVFRDPVYDAGAVDPNSANKAATVRQWLRLTLGDDSNVNRVCQSLLDLGFHPHVLDSGKPGSCSDGCQFYPTRRLKWESRLNRGINVLDRTSPLNTHKLGLLYANPSTKVASSLESSLLGAPHASPNFFRFMEGLGQLVETERLLYFSGGLDTSGANADGMHAMVWFGGGRNDFLTMVLFHTVPLFPPDVNKRKRHVGNDHVHIVYVDEESPLYQQLSSGGSDVEMEFSVVSGQFGFIAIFVLPTGNMYRLAVRLKPGLKDVSRTALEHLCGDYLLPANRAGIFVRQTAVCADIIIGALMEEVLGTASNWEERWNQLHAMERYVDKTVCPPVESGIGVGNPKTLGCSLLWG